MGRQVRLHEVRARDDGGVGAGLVDVAEGLGAVHGHPLPDLHGELGVVHVLVARVVAAGERVPRELTRCGVELNELLDGHVRTLDSVHSA